MMPPPTLSGIGSDEDEDDDSSGPPLSLNPNLMGMQMPPALSGFGSDDEDNPPPKAAEDLSKTAFSLSQSGAFKVSDFQLRPEGGLLSIGEDAPTEHAHPTELGAAHAAAPTIDVSNINDLEMLDELGSGASGTVCKARHKSTGTIVAVKSVTER